MQIPAIMLTIAVFGGIAMQALRGRGRPLPPLALAFPYALVVIAAAVALLTAVREHTVPTVTLVALSGFIVAAVAGTLLFLRSHVQKKPRPLPLSYVHQAIAAISIIMFLVCIFGP